MDIRQIFYEEEAGYKTIAHNDKENRRLKLRKQKLLKDADGKKLICWNQ
jgi:hypothetical protein